jgi:hypothetical protein
MSNHSAGTVALSVATAAIGALLEKKVIKALLPWLYEPSPTFPAFPRSYGFLIIVLTGFSFWHLVFGKARVTCKAEAEKDLGSDTSRYDYSHLHVARTSEHAICFNSVQRAHQHVLESITPNLCCFLTLGTSFPVTTTVTACWVSVGPTPMRQEALIPVMVTVCLVGFGDFAGELYFERRRCHALLGCK